MTKAQELQVRELEIRESINKLLGMPEADRPDDYGAQLDTQTAAMTALTPELRAALAAAPEPEIRIVQPGDAETRERRRIAGQTGISEFLAAAAGGRAVSGAAAEYAAACKVSDVGRIPLDIFTDRRPETRAITAGPAVVGPPQPTVPYVFERSAAMTLGIQMPTVPAGQVQIPRVTAAPPAGVVAKDASAPSTAATVTLDSRSPVRIAGAFEVRVEDLAVWPELEDALSESIRGALSDRLDEETFNGAAGGLNGLFTQAANVSAASSEETYATGIARFAALVDGRYAYDLMDVRAVIGSATYAKYMSLFANTNKGDITLFDYLSSKMGSLRVSDRVPDVASTAQKGIAVLTAAMESIRCFVWSSLEIVRDPYSAAGEGKVTLTATALVSPLYIPHGTAQVKEVHPKLS